MTIDPAIFAHAEPELADLRVYQEGIETPYVIQLAKPIKEVEKSIAPLNLGDRHGLTVFDCYGYGRRQPNRGRECGDSDWLLYCLRPDRAEAGSEHGSASS